MKRYKDFYGNVAYLKELKNGSCKLTIYYCGKVMLNKKYKTERGAKIALGKYGEGFEQVV